MLHLYFNPVHMNIGCLCPFKVVALFGALDSPNVPDEDPVHVCVQGSCPSWFRRNLWSTVSAPVTTPLTSSSDAPAAHFQRHQTFINHTCLCSFIFSDLSFSFLHLKTPEANFCASVCLQSFQGHIGINTLCFLYCRMSHKLLRQN